MCQKMGMNFVVLKYNGLEVFKRHTMEYGLFQSHRVPLCNI